MFSFCKLYFHLLGLFDWEYTKTQFLLSVSRNRYDFTLVRYRNGKSVTDHALFVNLLEVPIFAHLRWPKTIFKISFTGDKTLFRRSIFIFFIKIYFDMCHARKPILPCYHLSPGMYQLSPGKVKIDITWKIFTSEIC